MTLTLTANITATDTVLQVTGTVGAEVVPGYLFAIDDEVLRFNSYERAGGGPLTAEPTADDVDRWSVSRGWFGSAKASHLADAALTEFSPAVWAALAGADSPSGANPFATVADAGGISTATLALSSNQIKALSESPPVALVAGVAGHLYWPIGGIAVYTAGLTPYTLTPSQSLYVGYSGAVAGLIVAPANGFLDQGGSTVAILGNTQTGTLPYGAPAPFDLGTVLGTALEVWLDTGVDPTDGDGTLDLTVLYVDLTP